jgi:hypothetical protein
MPTKVAPSMPRKVRRLFWAETERPRARRASAAKCRASAAMGHASPKKTLPLPPLLLPTRATPRRPRRGAAPPRPLGRRKWEAVWSEKIVSLLSGPSPGRLRAVYALRRTVAAARGRLGSAAVCMRTFEKSGRRGVVRGRVGPSPDRLWTVEGLAKGRLGPAEDRRRTEPGLGAAEDRRRPPSTGPHRTVQAAHRTVYGRSRG